MLRTWRYWDDVYRNKNWWHDNNWNTKIPSWLVYKIIIMIVYISLLVLQIMNIIVQKMIDDGVIELNGNTTIKNNNVEWFITFPTLHDRMQFICKAIIINNISEDETYKKQSILLS